jgi:GNAT superfamily N-acetyltransferase
MTSTLRIARAEATDDNLKIILRLIDGARGWLADKDTDQWSKPWPDREQRDARVWRGLEVGATWMVEAETRVVATVTVAQSPNPAVWGNVNDKAIYAHRLIIDRRFAGWGLGSQLIDWTGRRAQQEYGAEWIRIDVWTTNERLHEYYTKRGFEPCGRAADPEYPSGMLFQKPVSAISWPTCPLFIEPEAEVSLFGHGTSSQPHLDFARLPDRSAGGDGSLALDRVQDPFGSLELPEMAWADGPRVSVGT